MERYTNWDFFKDVCLKTDKKIKSQIERRQPEVVYQIRRTPAHKPGVRSGK
jgi:hypothetical protein